jgi:signal transduction histidine kinase
MPIDRALLRASWRSWLSNDGSHVGPGWMQWLWTLMFCAGLAVMFTVMSFFAGAGRLGSLAWWLRAYTQNLIVCLTIGALIHLLFQALVPLVGGPAAIRRWPNWKRTVFFSGTPLLGLVIGWPIGVQIAGGDLVAWFGSRSGLRIITASLLMALTISFLMHHWFAAKARQFEAEKRAAEAQLRLLQAQMEPHFLFNTLANVLSLIDADAPRAKRMLEAFTDYLRSSLGSLRRDDATLESELELVEAYLGLQQLRMDDRLRYSIAADPAVRAVALPPMLLQPLVENAVLHGLERKLEGGGIEVTARLDGAHLLIEVRDDGLGPGRAAPRPGHGLALTNLRERLRSRYGDAASLDVMPAHPGTRATLRLPLSAQPI